MWEYLKIFEKGILPRNVVLKIDHKCKFFVTILKRKHNGVDGWLN